MGGASSQKKIDEFVSKLNLNNSQAVEKELRRATQSGELANLKDNRQDLEKIIKQRSTQIKRGEYDAGRRAGDYREMLKSGNLTSDDKAEVKSLFGAFGKKASQKPASSQPKVSTVPVAKSRPWKPWEKMPAFLKDRLNPTAKNKPYSPSTGSSRPAGNRDSNLSSTQGGSNLSPSSSSSNPPRLIR